MPVRLFVLTRHGRSTLNAEGRINGDPSVPAPLTAEGRAEAERLGRQLAELPIDLCVHTRFPRTRETADGSSPAGRADARGAAARRHRRRRPRGRHDRGVRGLEAGARRRDDPFPGGESLDDAARRYARAFRTLLDRAERTILVVCHEIPVRYALNAAAGSDELDGPDHSIPNATPYLFDDESLARAAAGIERLAG